MSSEEEKAIIGGVVLEHDQVRKRIATIEAELVRVSGRLEELAARMKRRPSGDEGFVRGVTKLLEDVPGHDRILELANDLRAQTVRRLELRKTLREHGIEL